MIDDRQAIRTAFEAIIVDHADEIRREADASGWSDRLWQHARCGGFTTVAVAEAAGGSAGDLLDLAAVLHVGGYHAVPIPLAEANIAAIALARAGRNGHGVACAIVSDVAAHPGAVVTRAGDGGRAAGQLRRIPWASRSDAIVLLAEQPAAQDARPPASLLGVIATGECRLTPLFNIAGEPLADVQLPAEGVPLTPVAESAGVSPSRIGELLSLARVQLMNGSMRRIFDLSVRYAGQREQFGRPIATFQAVQHLLAQLAGAVEQSEAMADVALHSLAADESGGPAVLAARVCAGEGAGLAILIGHQVHGAIGVTLEYELHRHTRRLMAWRDRDGSEVRFATEFGRWIAQAGPERMWDLISGAPGNVRSAAGD